MKKKYRVEIEASGEFEFEVETSECANLDPDDLEAFAWDEFMSRDSNLSQLDWEMSVPKLISKPEDS